MGCKMTIALFDQRVFLREAINMILKNLKNVQVVCETGDKYKTLSYIKETCPDLVVLDPALFKNHLLSFIHTMLKLSPRTKFALLKSSDDIIYYNPALLDQNIIDMCNIKCLERILDVTNT